MPRKEAKVLEIRTEGLNQSIKEIVEYNKSIDQSDQKIEQLNKTIAEFQQQNDRLQSMLQNTEQRLRDVTEELDRFKSGAGIDILESELKRFKDTAAQSAYELHKMLEAMNLIDDWGRGESRFSAYLHDVENGCQTVGQAMTELKMEFAHLFEEAYRESGNMFHTELLESFKSSLDEVLRDISAVMREIYAIREQGVTIAGGGPVGSGGGADVSEMFHKIQASAEDMGEAARTSVDKVVALVDALQKYADIDSVKLLGVSQAFQNIAALKGVSVSEKSVDHIINLATRLRDFTEHGAASFRFDLTGLNGIKISSTIRHLTDVLPTIDKVNVDTIERLAKVDWKNFAGIRDLKISQANADNLKNLFSALGSNTGTGALDKEKSTVADVNKVYESHEAILKAAADAEKAKAKVSGELAGELRQEAAASKNVADEAKRDAEASHVYTENTEKEADAIRKKEAELSKVNTKLKEVQTLMHSMAAMGGTGTVEYAALEKLESELQNLQNHGATKPFEVIRDALSNITLRLSDARQGINLFTMAVKDEAAAEKEVEAAVKAVAKVKAEEDAMWREHGPADRVAVQNAAALNAIEAEEAKLQRQKQLDRERAGLLEYEKSVADAEARQQWAEEAAWKAHLEALRERKKEQQQLDSELQKVIDNTEKLGQEFENVQARIDKIDPKTLTDKFGAAYDRLRSTLGVIQSENTSPQDKVDAYKDWAMAIGTVNSYLKNMERTERDTAKATRETAQEQAAAKKEAEARIAVQTRLQSLLNTVNAAKHTTGIDTDVNAYSNLTKAIQEVIDADKKMAWSAEDLRAVYALLNQEYVKLHGAAEERARDAQRNADAAKAEAEGVEYARKAANQIEDLEKRINGLKDSSKFDDSVVANLKSLKDEFTSSGAKSEELKKKWVEFKAAAEEAARAVKKLEDAEREHTKSENDNLKAENRKQQLLKQAQGLLLKITKAQQDWSKAQNNPATREEYKNLETYKSSLTGLISQLQSGSIDVTKFDSELRKLNASFAQTSTAIQSSGTAIRSYFSAGLQQLSSRMATTFGFAAIVTKTIAEVKRMITTATELDTAMNQLQIVTRGSSADMTNYAKSVSAMAKETAQSTKDLIDATTVYARLGYTMDESASLAKYTAMLQGVGDVEAQTAQNAMTAILKAFDVQVDGVEAIMDKLVTVGKIIAHGYSNAA